MRLEAHGWQLDLLPGCGGTIAALAHDGRDVLRAGATGLDNPLDGACFPLVPYANRIAHGRFSIDGIAHRLPRNFGDHPHSLHGVGWQRPWDVTARGDGRVTLAHAHDGQGSWPWSYRAEQAIALEPATAKIALALTNTDTTPMPAGLGLHPYFACDAMTRLTTRATRLWLTDAELLPTSPAPADRLGDWARGATVEGDDLIDNAYEGWDGIARIEHDGHVVVLEATGAGNFYLYRPPGLGYFCVEPVSHLPDAINRGGMATLAPGETTTLAMRLTVAA